MSKVVECCAAAILAAVFFLLLTPAPTQAQTGSTFRYFLSVNGIKGESQEMADAFDVQSFSFGVNIPIDMTTTGRWTSGRASFQDLSLSIFAGKASPELFQAAATGKQIDTATLTGITDLPDGRRVEMVYTLGELFVNGYQSGGSNGGSTFDNISIAYARIKFEYRVPNPNGGTTLTRGCFDRETIMPC